MSERPKIIATFALVSLHKAAMRRTMPVASTRAAAARIPVPIDMDVYTPAGFLKLHLRSAPGELPAQSPHRVRCASTPMGKVAKIESKINKTLTQLQ